VKRLAIGVLVGLAVGAGGVGAQQSDEPLPPHETLTKPIVQSAMKHSLAAILAPPPKALTRYRVYNCMHGRCRFRVVGTADCRGVARSGLDRAGYYAWITRMACHSRRGERRH
jgi:hypothetical protein